MTIDVCYTAADAEIRDFASEIVIVVDVLRATTTIAAALEAGASAIIPVGSVDDAYAVRETVPGSLLCGERHGVALEGFDFGNSPVEISSADISERTIVLTTTNGTRTTVAASGARALFAACLRNVSAVVEAISELGGSIGETAAITIACAGTDGSYSIDDVYAAGLLVTGFERMASEITDAARAAQRLAADPVADVVNQRNCRHVRVLESKGFRRDIEYALEIDAASVVARYLDGAFVSVST